MVFTHLLIFTIVLGFLSMTYNNKFLLSIIISIEFMLLNIIVSNLYIGVIIQDSRILSVSLFILTLSAIEASIGISIVALLSRNLNEVNFNSLNILKS